MSKRSKPRPEGRIVVDASGPDGFYGLGGGTTEVQLVMLEVDTETGFPRAGDDGWAVPDPRNYRLHHLPGTLPTGELDHRLSIQIVNDYEGDQAAPGPDDAPGGQPEFHAARNRSTREADLYGRVAVPSSLRRIVDDEEGRYSLAITIGDHPLGDAQGAAGSGEVTTTSLPGVAFAEAGARSTAGGLGAVKQQLASVSIDGLTVFGDAAVQAAKDAIAAGGSKDDVAQAALAASQGRPPPPLGSQTRDPAQAALPPPPPVVRAPGRAAGYVADGQGKVGMLSTLVTPSGQPSHWHVGREGSRIGILPLRHDAQFAMGPIDDPKVGRLALVGRDAKDIPRGTGKLVKGELWFDSSRKNVDSELGDETGQWVVVVALDPSGMEFPERTGFIAGKGGKPPKPPPPGGGGGGGGGGPEQILVPNPFDPSGPFGKGLLPFPPEPKGKDNIITSPDGGLGDYDPGDGGVPFVDSDGGTGQQGGGAGQRRDFAGPGVPCPNVTGGLIIRGITDAVKAVGVVPDPTRLGGAVVHNVTAGHMPVTQLEDGRIAIGGTGEAGGTPQGSLILDAFAGGNPFQRVGLGGTNAANVQIPFTGSPGAPKTVAGMVDLLTAKVNALSAVIQGLAGGPSYLAANIAAVHRNGPGNPPAATRLGSHWVAGPGQALAITEPAVQHVSILEARDGGSIEAGGAGVQEVRRAVIGSVVDRRPLMYLVNDQTKSGQVQGDVISTPSRGFRVDADEALGASKVSVLLDQTKPMPEFPLSVGYRDPATGDMLGSPSWALRQDGGTLIQDLSDTPDPPGTGSVLLYSKSGAVYQQTEDGTETALGSASGVTIQEEDGTPAGTLTTLKFPNGSLTDNGGGSFSYAGTAGAGDVTGPASATDNAIVRFDGSTGKAMQASTGWLLGDTGVMAGQELTLTTPLAVAQGGSGSASASGARTNLGLVIGTDVQAQDPVLQHLADISLGTANQVLKVNGAGTALEFATGVTSPVAVTSGGTGLTGITSGHLLYGSASDVISANTPQNVFASTVGGGSGVWGVQAGTWSAIGTTARTYLGSPAAGTFGFQGKLDLSFDAAAAANADMGAIAATNHGGGSRWLDFQVYRASGNDGTGDLYGIRTKRATTTIGGFAISENDGTGSGNYDQGVFKDPSLNNKFIAYDRSKNGPNIISDGGINMTNASGSLATPASGTAVWGIESNIPTCKVHNGTTTNTYVMPKGLAGQAADPGDPSGFTTLGEMITWAGSLRTNMRSSGAALML